jgi:phage terminase small subunit
MPAGRPRQPVELLKQRGKKHLTKSEIARRKAEEVKLGKQKIAVPEHVKKDITAYKKWQEIIKIYKGTDVVSSSDAGFLARYCMTWSEYIRLCETRNRLGNLQADWSQYENVLPEDFKEAIEKALSLNADLQLESAINKKMELLIKMEDRSFLNPLAKVKGIPQPQEKPKKTALEKKGFANV